MARSNAFWLAGLCAALAIGPGGCRPKEEVPRIDFRHAYFDARATLLQSVDDPDPKVRVHALEALAATEPEAAGGVVMQAMRKNPLPVVTAAVVAIGDIRHAPAKDDLLRAARDPDTPPKLMCAILYALHRLGDDTYTTELGRLLHHEDELVRAEAARMMGKMDVPSAVGPLKSRQADEVKIAVRLNIAEALARLGDERSVGLLEAFAKDQYMESRLIAVDGLGMLDQPRAKVVLRKVTHDENQDPIVRVAAAKNLARLGDPAGYDQALAALTDPQAVLREARGEKVQIPPVEITRLQIQAALALGKMNNPMAVGHLHPLLQSSRGPVRIAAAQAILELLPEYGRQARARPAERPPEKAPPEDAGDAPRPKLHRADAKD